MVNRWLRVLLALVLLLPMSGCGKSVTPDEPTAKDVEFTGDGAGPGEGCTFTSDCKNGLVCSGDLCLIPGADAGKVVDTGGGSLNGEIDLKNYTNNWVRGYSIQLSFKGGPADGDEMLLQRDLYEVPGSFSFGSTHYSQGEVGLAVADTVQVKVKNDKGEEVTTQLENWFNFGLVVGSDVNPVHVDKTGDYPFNCKAPFIRVQYKFNTYMSTCPKLSGRIKIINYGNDVGQKMTGDFIGRLQAYFKQGSFPDDCNPDHTVNTCKKPDWYVDVKGFFSFELPEKDKGGG